MAWRGAVCFVFICCGVIVDVTDGGVGNVVTACALHVCIDGGIH